MLINLSNHPSTKWSEEQLCTASEFGEIVDMPFPVVAPDASREEIQREAIQIVDGLPCDKLFVLHVMGEMTLTFAIVSICKSRGIKCVASTTERIVFENRDGTKVSNFHFVQFREY